MLSKRPSKGGSLVALSHPFVYLCRLTSGGNCRFRKLSILSCQLLSAVGTLVTNCRHILTQCRLSLKPLGRPHQIQASDVKVDLESMIFCGEKVIGLCGK